MDILIIIIRIAVTLTFLILACGGPYAIIKLSNFIKDYRTAHEALESRVSTIEKGLGITPPGEEKR